MCTNTLAVTVLTSCCACRDLLDGKIPSDKALLQDAEIRQYAEQYATDQVTYLLKQHVSKFPYSNKSSIAACCHQYMQQMHVSIIALTCITGQIFEGLCCSP